MKFGRYLEEHMRDEWREHYLHYNQLKSLIKSAAQLRNTLRAPNDFISIFTPSALSRQSPQESFFVQLELDVAAIQKFSHHLAEELRSQIQGLHAAIRAAAPGGVHQLSCDKHLHFLQHASTMSSEYLAVEQYVNLNYVALQKILKKHDKWIPSARCQQFYKAHISHQPWVRGEHHDIQLSLSKLFTQLHSHPSHAHHQASQGHAPCPGGGPAPKPVLSTHKYWVRLDRLAELKHLLLQHLPVSEQEEEQAVPSPSPSTDARDDLLRTADRSTVSCVYLDNSGLELYHNFLHGRPYACILRLWWRGRQPPQAVHVQRRVFKEGWQSEKCCKDEFTLPVPRVAQFLSAQFTWSDMQKTAPPASSSPTLASSASWQAPHLPLPLTPTDSGPMRDLQQSMSFCGPLTQAGTTNTSASRNMSTPMLATLGTSSSAPTTPRSPTTQRSPQSNQKPTSHPSSHLQPPTQQPSLAPGRHHPPSAHHSFRQGTHLGAGVPAVKRSSDEGMGGQAASEYSLFRSFNEIQRLVDTKALQPTIRTRVQQTVFRRAVDPSVVIELEEDVRMWLEFTSDGRDSMSSGMWLQPFPRDHIDFPYAILKIHLVQPPGSAPPDWLASIFNSGLVTEVLDFSKYVHACAGLMPDMVRALPYWIDDPAVQKSLYTDPSVPYAPTPHHYSHTNHDHDACAEGQPAMSGRLLWAENDDPESGVRSSSNLRLRSQRGSAPELEEEQLPCLACESDHLPRVYPDWKVQPMPLTGWQAKLLQRWLAGGDAYSPTIIYIDPMQHMHTEIVFLMWLKTAVTVAGLAFGMLCFCAMAYVDPSEKFTLHIGEATALWLLLLSIVLCAYGLVAYVQRTMKQLSEATAQRSVDRTSALVVLALALVIMVMLLLLNTVDLIQSLVTSA